MTPDVNWTVAAMERTEKERGLERARAVAQWFLGDPEWADAILRAFHGDTNLSREAEEGLDG